MHSKPQCSNYPTCLLTFKNMSGETSSTMLGKPKKPATTRSDRTKLDAIACHGHSNRKTRNKSRR